MKRTKRVAWLLGAEMPSCGSVVVETRWEGWWLVCELREAGGTRRWIHGRLESIEYGQGPLGVWHFMWRVPGVRKSMITVKPMWSCRLARFARLGNDVPRFCQATGLDERAVEDLCSRAAGVELSKLVSACYCPVA